jgi:hypothetical protein
VVQTVLEAKAAQETQFTSVIEGFSFSLLLWTTSSDGL